MLCMHAATLILVQTNLHTAIVFLVIIISTKTCESKEPKHLTKLIFPPHISNLSTISWELTSWNWYHDSFPKLPIAAEDTTKHQCLVSVSESWVQSFDPITSFHRKNFNFKVIKKNTWLMTKKKLWDLGL